MATKATTKSTASAPRKQPARKLQDNSLDRMRNNMLRLKDKGNGIKFIVDLETHSGYSTRLVKIHDTGFNIDGLCQDIAAGKTPVTSLDFYEGSFTVTRPSGRKEIVATWRQVESEPENVKKVTFEFNLSPKGFGREIPAKDIKKFYITD